MIATVDHGPVRELRLERPPVNALDPTLIQALRSAIERARNDKCGALVLSGVPGMFSGGLDVPAFLRLGRPELRATWELFFALLKDIAFSSVPIAAAITGHSAAGGTVVAIFADYRIIGQGPFLVGLNEVRVGLPLPRVVYQALVHVVGFRQAERLAVAGLLVPPDEALRCGLVDEIVSVDEVIPRATAWAAGLISLPTGAMSATRHLARGGLREAFDHVDSAMLEGMVDHWFSSETQSAMQALVAKLGKRR
jgi:Delta3-Delta2-enoyl-CoA isomerase